LLKTKIGGKTHEAIITKHNQKQFYCKYSAKL